MTTGVNISINKESDGTEARATPDGSPPMLFNRELSWLEFNRRVLEEALSPRHPLLERLKFLAIFSTNLDEFFMVRVSGLQEELEEGVVGLSADGLTPAAQLKSISCQLRPMLDEHMRCLRNDILPALAAHGVVINSYRDLSQHHQQTADKYFLEKIFPMLTPQAVDPGHPFPYISNLSLNLGVVVEDTAGSVRREQIRDSHVSSCLRSCRDLFPLTIQAATSLFSEA